MSTDVSDEITIGERARQELARHLEAAKASFIRIHVGRG